MKRKKAQVPLPECLKQRVHNKPRRDDARVIINRSSAKFDVFIKEFYVIGSLPWDNDTSPRFLYKHSNASSSESVFISFCFPKQSNINIEKRSVPKLSLLREFVSPDTSYKFFPLYFPQDDTLRFAFCMQLRVNELTIPAFCHELSLPEILAKIDNGDGTATLTTTTIVLVMRCKVPFIEAVSLLMEWILQCESITRMIVSDQIDNYVHSGFVQSGDLPWPEQHRRNMTSIISNICQMVTPDPGGSFDFDFPPFPVFKWIRQEDNHPYIPLGKYLMKKIVPAMEWKLFLRVFSEVIREKSVIVFSSDVTLESEVVLCLQVLLRPFLWISGSVSCLPESLVDMVSSPSPVLIGTTFPVENIEDEGVVYADLDRGIVKPKWQSRDFVMPKELSDAVKANWKVEKAEVLFACIHSYMERIESFMEQSIMTDITDCDDVNSQFLDSFFFGHFDPSEHKFFEAFCSTQMFRFMVEQKCRRKSDAVMSSVKPC